MTTCVIYNALKLTYSAKDLALQSERTANVTKDMSQFVVSTTRPTEMNA
jgi:hypothetical protein